MAFQDLEGRPHRHLPRFWTSAWALGAIGALALLSLGFAVDKRGLLPLKPVVAPTRRAFRADIPRADAVARIAGRPSENRQPLSEQPASRHISMAQQVTSKIAAGALAMAALQTPAWALDPAAPVLQPPEALAPTTQAGVQATLGVKVQQAPALTIDSAAIADPEQSFVVRLARQGEAFCGPASFAFVFITMLMYWIQAAFYPESKTLKQASYACLAVSNLLIAGLLSSRWVYSGHFPLSNLYESLMFLSWGVSTVPLALERQVAYGVSTGAIVTPLVLLINAFATLILPPELQRASALVPALKSNWLMMHVSVMMMSYAVLLAGSVMAMVYLFVTRSGGDPGIRPATASEAPRPAPSLPAGAVLTLDGTVVEGPASTRTLAETLDDLSYRTLVFGFPLLTIGIISGAVWANEAWGSYWSWDPKETWALITWLVFSFYLHTRLNKGWKGRPSAWVAAGGFVVVWICYIGVNLFGVGLHSYGFFSQS